MFQIPPLISPKTEDGRPKIITKIREMFTGFENDTPLAIIFKHTRLYDHTEVVFGLPSSDLLKGGEEPNIAGGIKYAALTFDSRTG